MKKIKEETKNQKSKQTGKTKTQTSMKTNRASLKLKFKAKRAHKSKLSPMTSRSCLQSLALTAEFTTTSVLFNAKQRTATSGFAMERDKTSLGVIFFGTW